MVDENLRQAKLMQVLVGEDVGGAERFFVKLAISLQKKGIEQLLAISRNAERATELRDAGCRVEEFDFRKGILDWPHRRRLNSFAYNFGPDICLAWMNRAARRIPSGDFVKVGRIGGYYKAKNYRRCNWIIANSPDLKRHIIQDGWPSDRTVMISNFGMLQTTKPIRRQEFQTPEDAYVLLALGRLHYSKGFDTLLAALTKLPDNAYIWLAGSGEEETMLREIAVELGVSERVRFLGWRSDQAAMFSACDVCVVPSRHEPLSNVIVEAWTIGIPVVATSAEGPSWLIQNGENGLLSPIDNAEALAHNLNSLIADPELGQRIVAGGLKSVREEFSETAIVSKFIEFFDQVRKP